MKDAVLHLIRYTTLKSRFCGLRKTTKPRDSTRNDSVLFFKIPLNASLSSSSLSASFIFRAIIVRNSGKSIVPFPVRIKQLNGVKF